MLYPLIIMHKFAEHLCGHGERNHWNLYIFGNHSQQEANIFGTSAACWRLGTTVDYMITFYSTRYFAETPVKKPLDCNSRQSLILVSVELLSNINTLSQVFDNFTVKKKEKSYGKLLAEKLPEIYHSVGRFSFWGIKERGKLRLKKL